MICLIFLTNFARKVENKLFKRRKDEKESEEEESEAKKPKDDDDKGKLKSLGMTMVAGPTRFMPLFQPLQP